MPAMLSAVLEEEADMYEAFPPHVDPTGITILTDSPPGKKAPLKTFEEVQPLLQQSRKRELKLVIRENSWPINSPVRALLWPALCRQHQHGKSMLDGFYWDMVTQVFGTVELPDKPIMLPPFVEATHCLGYHLTRKGRAVADRVVSVLGYACPDITYSPSLYPITAALLHFMPEEECYHCMASLVASKDKMFITQTKLLNEVTWKTVMQIAKKHAKSAAQHLSRLSGAIGPERIYTDWQWWILAALPFPHLVRVLDCFFHEGIKVFYRVALAILILFHKHSTNQSSDWYAEATKNGVDHAIDKFCRNMPASPTKLLRTAFSIRALSSQYISRVFIKTEMTLKSKQVITGSRLVRSRSSDNLPTSQSQVNIQMMSHTLTIRESPRSSHLALWFPFPNAVFADQKQHSSDLRQKLFTLWSWLPVRITMYQPVLLYTTEEHGCSLTTFYVRVEHHEPTLLMIKTCNNEVGIMYTTEEHGCSLTTFYVRVEHHEPTLLMIKTCNNEVGIMYTTEEHGCSLTTFYVRVEHHEPTLLMIKTCNNEVGIMYTTEEHGCSLTTFYVRVEHHEPTLLMIKTCNNEVGIMYTTEEHGCSLTTFYVRVEHHEPTLLMIKTCNNEVGIMYTTEEHGCSLTTFYVRVEHHEPTLLMIKTCNNEVGIMYTTEEHGCSLTTFYVRVEHHDPTLLMIKTCNNEVGIMYTTEEHGCSLTTFYVRVEHHEPTLLMIKTCNNEVFGAYCSTRWFERNQKDERGNRQAYFGTGETFLFSLYPERAKYPWVGCGGDSKETVAHGSELFMAADSRMITIGGGDGQAIWMDENIRFGKTDRCSTFNNPPLCPSGDFEIRVLEVYGFSGA
ncbi:GTPase-activating protein skywalker isoform X3 [Cydia strobilella]|uniref:GTPase-activating protein skywalker isoform X3 n=1 Tax=Cydia strobilella TaxID=1100964 RepID=UPI003003BA14